MSSEEEQSVEQEMVLQQEDDNYEHITMKKHNQKQLESLLFLRVLLVENDDSSRIVISALLRKCGYTVVAVSDGSKAWEILRGRASNIDLVLTELDLPSLAGFSLLRFMMEDDICRQIPVIMMSSHDSINVVFDSMLGGAADFLLKPLRKNELRNLWQHVWRRHSFKNSGHNSSPNVNHVQQKVEASEENGSTECSSDCVAFPKVHKECSEKGSDAQSSCTKPETEVQSANMPTVSHPVYRTTSVDNGTMTSTYGECVEMESLFLMHDNEAKDESVMLGPEVVHNKRKKLNGTGSEGEFSAASSKQLEPSREAMDFIGAFDTHYNTHSQEISFTDGDADLYKHSSTSLLELSLKRPYYGDPEIPQISERNTLNHSNASAFSHYDDRTLQPHFVTSTEVCAEAHECASASCKHLSNQAFGDTIDKCPQSCGAMKDCPETMTAPVGGDQHVKAKSVFSCAQHGVISATSVMPPLFFAQSVPLPLQSSLTASQHKSVVPEHFNHEYKETDYLHSQNANNASNQAMNGLKEKKLETLEDPRYVSTLSAQSASSSLCNSVVSQLNSSECGSDCSGSNENTVTILGSSNGSANEKIFLTGDRTRGLDSHCFTQREAALTKFRLKRKDRCFEKKVRYQSRKRLAEQRPRVKGQFVRQNSPNFELQQK